MSHANRATSGFHGSTVRLDRSGIAIMSGSCGPWPMSPAAKPAKPAPSDTRSSRWCAGTSFAFGLPFSSTNWAKKNSTPRSFTTFLTSSTLCGASTRASVIPPPFESPLFLLPLALLDACDLAGVRVHTDQGQAPEGLIVLAGNRERDDPEGFARQALAEQSHLRVLRSEVNLPLCGRDRLLLRDPDLRLLAAAG